MKLTLGQRIFVNKQVEELFEAVKAKLQGRFYKGPAIYFFAALNDTNPTDTIEGLYQFALKSMYGAHLRPDIMTIEHLNEILGNYLEAQKLKVKNHLIADISSAKTWVQAHKAVKVHLDKSTKYLDMLVATEAKTVVAYANKEGITRLAADLKVEDPCIVFFGRVDAKLCKYCREMYHNPANPTQPRPWRLSQLRDGYFKPKEWDHKSCFNSGHPNCRHSMSFVPPGSSLDAGGHIYFKAFGHDFYNEYHGITKSEENTPLDPTEFFMDYDKFLGMEHHEHEREL